MTFTDEMKDRTHYNTEMSKSMIDKFFFLDKVYGAETFVDFGCADGVLLKAIAKLFPSYRYFGYDISTEMIAAANHDNPAGIVFMSDWDELITKANDGKPKVLILSSIIHEIYAYLNPTEIQEFWNKVWSSGFDYIVLRDMMTSRTTSRPSDTISVARVRQVYNMERIAEWESKWGSLYENWSLVHFLLTYRYVENWEREVKENYLPLTYEDFFQMIPREYFPDYVEHYTLPYVRNAVKQDFGFDLQDRTHVKLIFKKV